jgi:hypothetical protein
MQFEDFDKRIRDAADHHHPAYEEKAWTKMESLLDKHLPVEKDDRRRIIFIVLLFLLVGGAAWLFISRPWQSSSPVAGNIQEKTASTPGADSRSTTQLPATTGNTSTSSTIERPGNSANTSPETTGTEDSKGETINPITNAMQTVPATIPERKSPGGVRPGSRLTQGDDLAIQVSQGQRAQKNKTSTNRPTKTRDNDGSPSMTVITPADNNRGTTTDQPQPGNPAEKVIVATDPVETKSTATEPTSDPTATKDPTNVEAKKEDKSATTTTSPVSPSKKKPGKKQNSNGLFFTVSAGPDISSVGDNLGKLRPVYGAGLSYALNRFTIRTGFYAAKKVYSAKPNEYKPANPLPNPGMLYQIDARCKVYEIPVSVAFNFGKAKNHSWFGAAGLSSYLMKEEDYDYIYKYPGGQPIVYNWGVKNENKHFFSVLSLSGGYTRKLSKSVSFSAEPYIKIPVTGIGLGNVKLNSGGVMFTLSARLTGEKR